MKRHIAEILASIGQDSILRQARRSVPEEDYGIDNLSISREAALAEGVHLLHLPNVVIRWLGDAAMSNPSNDGIED